MAVKIQHKRGSKAGLPALSPGEFGLATDTNELFVGGNSENIQVPTLGSDGKIPAGQIPDSVASVGEIFTVTLLSTGWSNDGQTIQDARFVASGYAYFVNPADDDFTAWAEAIIRGQDVTVSGQMTFVCADAPSQNVTVKIIRMEAAESE